MKAILWVAIVLTVLLVGLCAAPAWITWRRVARMKREMFPHLAEAEKHAERIQAMIGQGELQSARSAYGELSALAARSRPEAGLTGVKATAASALVQAYFHRGDQQEADRLAAELQEAAQDPTLSPMDIQDCVVAVTRVTKIYRIAGESERVADLTTLLRGLLRRTPEFALYGDFLVAQGGRKGR